MNNKKEIILGIDPGLANVGWGILEVAGADCHLADYGSISTKPGLSLSERIGIIYDSISDIVNKYGPNESSVEKLFFAKNSSSAIEVAQARGSVLLALRNNDCLVNEYTPLEIKQALVGYGRASKQQVQFMVKQFLKMEKIPSPDHAADALAAALCHLSSRKIRDITK